MHDLLTTAVLAEGTTILSALASVWDTVWPFLMMLAGFSVIIFVHELGHFAMAKWAGVRVERFAIGFGRELFGFTKGETRYSFNILPLGGYVKMLGRRTSTTSPRNFSSTTTPARSSTNPLGIAWPSCRLASS